MRRSDSKLPPNIRPQWRGLMLFALRSWISPLVAGKVPHCGGRGAVSVITTMLPLYAEKVPLQRSVELYERLSLLRKKKSSHGLSRSEVARLIPQTHALLGLGVHSDWGNALELCDLEFFSWYFVTNVVSFVRYRIPFVVLLQIARDGKDDISTDALCKAMVIEKSVINLPWVKKRFEKARVRNDNVFIRRIGKALCTPEVPVNLKKGALDFFLCVFDIWLDKLTLKEQVSLLREGGLKITENALRNRKSRAGISNVDREAAADFPAEILQMVVDAQVGLRKDLGIKKSR